MKAEGLKISVTQLILQYLISIGIAWLVMGLFFCWLRLTRRPAEKQVAWLTICWRNA